MPNMNVVNSTADSLIEMCNYGGSSTLFIVKQFPSRTYAVSQLFYCVANGVIAILTVLLNGISVLTIWKSSHLKTKLCYFLILIQSVVDLAVGAISLPFYIVRSAIELLDIANCVNAFVLQAVAYIPVGTSFTTICMLTFERYLSILHPIHHRSYVTKARVLIYISCVIVLVGITGPVFRIISEKLHSTFNVTMILIFLVFNTFAYARIYIAVKNMHFLKGGIGDSSTKQSSSNIAEKRRSLRERNLAKSCALVVVISYFCYIPFALCYPYFKDDRINFRTAVSWSATVVALNSSLNSLVFFWKRPLLRQEALKVLRKMYSKI